MPDGINGTFSTGIQPASGPALKEREVTYGEPKDEAKVKRELGDRLNAVKRRATEEP
jgi:hypothetical protein